MIFLECSSSSRRVWFSSVSRCKRAMATSIWSVSSRFAVARQALCAGGAVKAGGGSPLVGFGSRAVAGRLVLGPKFSIGYCALRLGTTRK